MRKIILLLISALFFFCSFDPPLIAEAISQLENEYLQLTKEAKRITIDEAYEIYKSGEALLISVDEPDHFATKHIVGAINIPFSKFEKGIKLSFPKDRIILLYCK